MLTRLSYRGIQREIERAEQVIKGSTDKPLRFRPPGGLLSFALLAYLWRRGPAAAPVLWSVCVPREYRKSADEIVTALEAARPVTGDIILLHDDNPKLVDALPRILDHLEAQGLHSVPIDELCS